MPAPQKETIDKGEREVQTKYFQEFKGVYTKASRNAIPQDHFYDLQNLMPIGAANLHTVPGPTLIQTVTGDTIYFSVFATLQSVDYLYLMGTSGKIYQYNINTPALTTINPSTLMGGTQTRMDQWKNSQILFCVYRLRNQEMQVAFFGMTENNGITIPVFYKQSLQISNCFAKIFQRHGYIFQHGRSAFCPYSCNGWIHSFSQFP